MTRDELKDIALRAERTAEHKEVASFYRHALRLFAGELRALLERPEPSFTQPSQAAPNDSSRPEPKISAPAAEPTQVSLAGPERNSEGQKLNSRAGVQAEGARGHYWVGAEVCSCCRDCDVQWSPEAQLTACPGTAKEG